MKRDMDLIRDILLAVENHPYSCAPFEVQVASHTPAEIGYHVMLLHQAGFLEAASTQAISDTDASCWKPISLTWEGHEFLEAARSSENWVKVKQIIVEKGSGLVLEVVKTLLVEVSKRAALSALTG